MSAFLNPSHADLVIYGLLAYNYDPKYAYTGIKNDCDQTF